MSTITDCIQIIRKLPPSNLKKNINGNFYIIKGLTNLIYEDDNLLNEFLQKIDQPLEIMEDEYGAYIKSEFNRDGNSFRSPISNNYTPEMTDGILPSQEIRDLEIKFNKIFQNYTRLYYSDSAISSVYVWGISDQIKDGMVVSILIKNSIFKNQNSRGNWDSINIVNVQFNKNPNNSAKDKLTVTYTLTTTIILQMNFRHSYCGDVDLSGNLTRSTEETQVIPFYMDHQAHIENIGKMVEEFECNLRNDIEEIYFKKTQEIIDKSRINQNLEKHNMEQANKLKDLYKEEQNKK